MVTQVGKAGLGGPGIERSYIYTRYRPCVSFDSALFMCYVCINRQGTDLFHISFPIKMR
jgi:hypothetical protein